MDTKRGLRKLREQKSKTKIDHPLAKYNNLGQITCIVCNLPLKNDLLWQPHLLSKKHKEAVNALKVKSSQTKESHGPPAKKFKTGVTPSTHHQQGKSSLQEEVVNSKVADSKDSVLPADFFDEGVAKAAAFKSEASNEKDESSSTTAPVKSISEKLPEGFFDDAKQDAKVRKVEYVDKKEEEWEQFQKMIAEETKVSENLQAEEEDEMKVERDLDEYATLKKYVSRVELLKQKREEKKIVGLTKGDDEEENNDTGSDESDRELDDMLNWRAKKA